jgi:hypothetical protein
MYGVMTLEFLDEATVEQIWSQLFPYHISPRSGLLYRTSESLDVEFCKTMMSCPLGPFVSAVYQLRVGVMSILQRPYLQAALTQQGQCDVANFL